MAALNSFEGGLQTRLDPTLVNPTFAVQMDNVDIDKGLLTPYKNHLAYSSTVVSGDRVYAFGENSDGTIRFVDKDNADFVEYRDKLYINRWS